MGKNKAQKEAEARAKKPQPAAEAERTREGSDNPAAIQAKMDEVAAQPKPNGKATPAAVAAAQPAVVSKQTQTIETLKAGWTAKGVDLSKLIVKDDGKFKLVIVDAGWPTVQVGASGGITVLELKSYAKAFDAAMDGLALYEKQKAREQKKTAATAPAQQPAAGKSEPAQPAVEVKAKSAA
jgi:hypothetical protein